MNFVILNGNPIESDFNVSISEIIYLLESKGVNVRNILLNNINDQTDINTELASIIQYSDMVIYASPIVNNTISDELKEFLSKYQNVKHSSIFLILEGTEDTTVQAIDGIINDFEDFSKSSHSKIIDIKYLEDAKESLIRLLN